MRLADVINTFPALIKLNTEPIIILIIVAVILSILKKISKNKSIKKIYWIDLVPFLAAFVLQKVTMTTYGYSYLPLFLLIWLIFGIGFLLVRRIGARELVLKQFLFTFWRISDLYWGILWVALLIIKCFLIA